MTFRLLAAMALLMCQTPAFALQDFTVTREELAMMPPFCTAIEGKFVGLPQFENSPLRNTVPSSCRFVLNHYCDGLKAMIRVNRTRDRNESDYWLGQASGAINSVIVEWDTKNPDCPLRAEAYLNLGKTQVQKSRRHGGSAGVAAVSFSRALELNPNLLDAYYALSDFYVESGNKQKALSMVEDGLRHLPDAKGLLRRFKELGGKTPPAPLARTNPQQPSQPDKMMGTQQQETGATSTSEHPAPTPVSSPDQSAVERSDTPKAPSATDETKIGTPTNPYCRFCPP